MSNQPQEQLFFEDIYDALRAAVQAAGGAKAVGPKLWPNKPVPAAHRDLLDALNRDRDRKLDPEETFRVFAIARDIGFHSAFHFACDSAGYHKPAPVSAKEQAQELAERLEAGLRDLRGLATQLERINASGVLRNISKTG